MLRSSSGIKLCLVVLYAASFDHSYVAGIQVTSTGPQTVKMSRGEHVVLGCTYSESPSDTGQLDVEWSIVSPDMTQKDQLILYYTEGKEFSLGDPNLMKRFKFITDPSRGDATVNLTSLGVSDTATYQCKVKKPPGTDSRKITLVVLVRPSVPKCWADSSEEIGGRVSLKCKSSDGTTPLTYKWTRENGGSLPPTAVQNPLTGELLISNHTQSYAGSYICEVSNEVGAEKCSYTLKAYNPVNRAGVIAGSVIGALLLLLLLLLLLWLCCCCYQKRRYEKETANEIKEDAAAPESRPPSRLSSIRSIMGYRTHQGLVYSSTRHSRPGRGDLSPKNSVNQSRPVSQSRPGYDSRYDSRYGFAV
ncbi:V-set and immunoglobulin domain-containing protein 8b [Trichomycterus rosablanca]|uniref:V-set and immunoglobulin domain-containing protein 8b n=1 Tax=Trichomycterus rosablanca TaxID=2290929 RepID=UPI002F3508AA